MGKSRTKRYKAHASAVKANVAGSKNKESDVAMNTSIKEPVSTGTDATYNPFSKLQIDMNMLQKNLGSEVDFDARSGITSKSLRGLNLTKKDKLKLKREFWSKKVQVIEGVRKEEKARKKRKKTVVVGDMQPLLDTLPTLELLLKQHTHTQQKEENKKQRSIPKTKKRKKEMLDNMNVFQQVLKDPTFKSDPMSTIKEHLHNRKKLEDAEDT